MSTKDIVRQVLMHPVKTMKLINHGNVELFMETARKSGFKTAVSTTIRVMDNYNKDCERLSNIDKYTSALDEVSEYLDLPAYEDPAVSIIIPVYNQYRFTRACIDSIIRNTGDVTYEVIIGDDCSSDETVDIGSHVSNLIVVRNEKNLGFLGNCNHAAKCAKGRYLLFLNNDTTVCEGWLEPLVNLISSSDKVGAVGSKLIYPDGLLQEAGGIIWSDGTAMNYGKGSDPELPEFNYVKEVDYITGASLMVRRDLFEEIGGFDPLYVPAYCEDSDLCLQVRNRGYSVLYQPLSKVIHFEGMTHGRNATARTNQHQQKNVVKLEAKWKDYLEESCNPPGKDIFHARDRSQKRRTIAFITKHLNSLDEECGPASEVIRILCEKGYNVKLLVAGTDDDVSTMVQLQQSGVETQTVTSDAKNLGSIIRSHKEDYDEIVLYGKSCVDSYNKAVQKCHQAKIYRLTDKKTVTDYEEGHGVTDNTS